jgi:CHAT domain-containing protein
VIEAEAQAGTKAEPTVETEAKPQAGPGAVGTLWSVNAISTALVMVRFYELHLRGENGSGPMSPARALRKAQLWLRDMPSREALEQYIESHEALAKEYRAYTRISDTRVPFLRILDDVISGSPLYWAPFTFTGV